MERTNCIDLGTDSLMATAVGYAARRQQCKGKEKCHWGGLFVDSSNDCDENRGDPPPRHRSISLSQLLYGEPLRHEAVTRPATAKLSLGVDADNAVDDDGLMDIQRLINSQYDACASRTSSRRDSSKACVHDDDIDSKFLDGGRSWCSSLPPWPVQHTEKGVFEEAYEGLGDQESAETSRRMARRESRSVGVQCDVRAATTAVELQKLEQLRQEFIVSDPESVAHALARLIRAVEMDRFGHSSAFTSALLQQAQL
ncbi:hypothetical protein TraAM80_05576 [Trypanosoma rangeli]|uniref:Uncharacterized protein n=1 Tax=Trypanosoma rangeli TaxID=5698 RepID=A0A422NE33_TRYRA|nr:uncharacterized protein TraAM80_05576 [Trypanosoma rangeli]RNF03753.1 hypothetical protein TraAM80_05576 [Trypanosoma rangeli]|eukprot:RNF03753.1 hypothetical protein TraAM80_05576 [Trypanosoma rangeli]